MEARRERELTQFRLCKTRQILRAREWEFKAAGLMESESSEPVETEEEDE